MGEIHVAESLLLARYFMYSQIYFHHVRRIYNIHLKEFLKDYLNEKRGEPKFSVSTKEFLQYTDSSILAEIYACGNISKSPRYEHGKELDMPPFLDTYNVTL